MERCKVLSCTVHYIPRLNFTVHKAYSSGLCRGLHIHKRRGICVEKARGFEIVSNFSKAVVKRSKVDSSVADSEEAKLGFCSLPGCAVLSLPSVLLISRQAGVKVSLLLLH